MSSLLSLTLLPLLSCSSAPEPPASEPPAKTETAPVEAPATASPPRSKRPSGVVTHVSDLPAPEGPPQPQPLVKGRNAALFQIQLGQEQSLSLPLEGQRAHLLVQRGGGSWSLGEDQRRVLAGELLSWPGGKQAQLRAGPKGLRGILTLSGEAPPEAEASTEQLLLREAPSVAPPSGAARVSHLDRSPSAYLGQLWLKGGGQVPAHRDPTEEYLLILEGEGSLSLDGEEHRLRAGHAVYMPAGAEVRFVNGPEPLLAFQVFAGPESAFKYEAWEPVTP